MTINQTNDPAEAAKAPAEPMDIDAAMARLILLRKFHELPRPVKYEISTGEFGTFHGIYVYVATGQDVTAWASALGIAEHRCGSFLGHDGSLYYDASVDGWHGWYVRVVSKAAAGSAAPSELDADTVAGLEAIAAPAEQTLAVDYGQDVPEVDEVAETTTAVAEPVISDDARTILDGLNARLDDRCDPVLGIDWAIRQPEVASADGPNVEGEYQVELADFTLIGWQPAERTWAVTVSDDIEGGESRIANREVSR